MKRTLLDSVYLSIRKLQLTLWMRDHGVNYVDGESEKEAWVDKLLWLCAIGDTSVAESEVSMKECIILNLFNQFRTGLEKSNSTIDQCAPERHQLTSCIAAENRHQRERDQEIALLYPSNENELKKREKKGGKRR